MLAKICNINSLLVNIGQHDSGAIWPLDA